MTIDNTEIVRLAILGTDEWREMAGWLTSYV